MIVCFLPAVCISQKECIHLSLEYTGMPVRVLPFKRAKPWLSRYLQCLFESLGSTLQISVVSVIFPVITFEFICPSFFLVLTFLLLWSALSGSRFNNIFLILVFTGHFAFCSITFDHRVFRVSLYLSSSLLCYSVVSGAASFNLFPKFN